MDETREKWDRIYSQGKGAPAEPSRVLEENAHLLPASGEALEIACGRGGNALFLARRGLSTLAWDISPVAIERLAEQGRDEGLDLKAEARDLYADPLPARAFDVVVVSHFLDRDLALDIVESLRPGGLLFFQTFTRTRLTDAGPSNDVYRLADNELLRLFGELSILVYREEGLVGDLKRGFRDEAMLVARRPTRD